MGLTKKQAIWPVESKPEITTIHMDPWKVEALRLVITMAKSATISPADVRRLPSLAAHKINEDAAIALVEQMLAVPV